MGIRNTKMVNDVNREMLNDFFVIQDLNSFESLYLLSSMDDKEKHLINLLEKDTKNKKKIVFIAADPDNYEKTDKYCGLGKKYFEQLDITEFEIVDYRMSKFAAIRHIETADILFLNGGDPVNQINFIQEYEIAPLITNFKGVLIGISAGAMNLAKNAYCSKDKEEGETWLYDGLGLVDVTVDPHFDINNKKQVKDFLAQDFEVIGLAENSFIKIDRYGIKTFFGEYYIKENNKIVKVK